MTSDSERMKVNKFQYMNDLTFPEISERHFNLHIWNYISWFGTLQV